MARIGLTTPITAAPAADPFASEDVGSTNPSEEKKLTNMRSSSADERRRLIRPLSRDEALAYNREDEREEVVPHDVRLRKVELSFQRCQSLSSRKPPGLAPVS